LAQGYVPALSFACVYAGLNDRERALEALEHAYVQKDPWLSRISDLGLSSTIYDPTRASPTCTDAYLAASYDWARAFEPNLSLCFR